MQSQLGEPGNDGLGRFPYGLPHLVAPGGGRPHVAISEISGLVSIVEKGRAQQVPGHVERGQDACRSNAVRQERLASREDEPAGEERGGQIVSIPHGPNDVRRIFEGFEMSVELKDRLRIAPLEAGRIRHRGLVSFSVRAYAEGLKLPEGDPPAPARRGANGRASGLTPFGPPI
jgi:hypothetical protein